MMMRRFVDTENRRTQGDATMSITWKLTNDELATLRTIVQHLRKAKEACRGYLMSPSDMIQQLSADLHERYNVGEFELFPEEDPEMAARRYDHHYPDTGDVLSVDFPFYARAVDESWPAPWNENQHVAWHPLSSLFAVAKLAVGESTEVKAIDGMSYSVRRTA
jgi:hypothetical protein